MKWGPDRLTPATPSAIVRAYLSEEFAVRLCRATTTTTTAARTTGRGAALVG